MIPAEFRAFPAHLVADMDSINSEVRGRIIAAADQLFEAAGRSDFPPVDAVRRAARADMNTISQVMREWRRMQTAQPAAVAVAIPDRVEQAQRTALGELWAAAQELANEALAAARQAWEAERAEADALRVELSQAFESQAGELAVAQARIAELEAAAKQAAAELAKVRDVLVQAQEQARTADTRAVEIERRAADLRAELDRTHAALGEQADAREQAALYRGELNAVREQNAVLLAMLKPADPVPVERPARKPRTGKTLD